MRISEAAYIGARLQEIPVEQLSPVLNLGSSNETFRTRTHPHVDREIFFPLVARGARVIHADMKADRGIDLVGDIYDAAFQEECRRLRPKTVVCCNILEHVVDPAEFARIVSALVPIDGYVVVSVPHSYPFHADPIDTLFRPSTSEIVDLFGSELSPVVTHTLTDITWLADLRDAHAGGGLAGVLCEGSGQGGTRIAVRAEAIQETASLPLAGAAVPDVDRDPAQTLRAGRLARPP